MTAYEFGQVKRAGHSAGSHLFSMRFSSYLMLHLIPERGRKKTSLKEIGSKKSVQKGVFAR
jgi:hypothetical protein